MEAFQFWTSEYPNDDAFGWVKRFCFDFKIGHSLLSIGGRGLYHFQPGGKTGFQALFTKVANVQSYHFHFLFWSFLCFSFYNVCSVCTHSFSRCKHCT